MPDPQLSTWAAVPPGTRVMRADGTAAMVGDWVDPVLGLRVLDGIVSVCPPAAPVIVLAPDIDEAIHNLRDAGFAVEIVEETRS